MTHQPLTDDAATRYSQLADEYATLWSPVIRPMGQRLVQALPLAEATCIVDVGTGVGALLPDIQAVASGAEIVGVDPAIGMLERAQRTITSPLVALAAMDARRLAFGPASFDVAVLAFMLFHLEEPVQGLLEVARVLRPGGTIGVATWGGQAGFPASEVWDQELATADAGPDPAAAEDRDYMMDTPDKLHGLLEQAGFGAVKAWAERFEHQWSPETLVAQRSGFGSYRRRLDTLDVQSRTVCLTRITERLAGMHDEDLVYRPEIVYAIGRRSQE